MAEIVMWRLDYRNRLKRLATVIAFTVLIGWSFVASASEQTNTVSKKTSFVVGNIEFVLLHELAHLVVTDKKVPQLAPPEIVADYIAINMALDASNDPTAKQFLSQALVSTATAFSVSWNYSTALNKPVSYWDTHALGIQRYYTSICLLYGSAPMTYRALAEFIPKSRRAGCAAEYQLAREGYDWLLANYSKAKEAGGQLPADTQLEVSQPKDPIRYIYGQSNSIAQDKLLAEIRSLNLIENTVNAVDEVFELSRPITVKMERCGRTQASWQPIRRELIICHEMMDAFARIYAMQDTQTESQ